MKRTPTKQELDCLEAEIHQHVGQGNAIHAGEWAEKSIGIKEKLRNWHVMARMFETQLIYERGIPLCACGGGYFLPKTETELNDYLQRLALRAQSIMRRAKQVRRNYYRTTKRVTLALES